MIKKLFFAALLFVTALSARGQQPAAVGGGIQQYVPYPIIGYLSYDSVLTSMPQYTLVLQQMIDLQSAFDAEMQRVEDEFNQKYESFLDGQKEFPRTILLKRQTELQELLQRNIDFKHQGQEELRRAEAEAVAPLRNLLTDAIARVAAERQLILVVNTDSNACPFIDPLMGIDITADVLKSLEE